MKVTFKNNKGQNLLGILHIPKGEGPFPAIIICHGFKGNKNSPLYSFLARKFQEAGFLTLRFDFHGHGESDGHFENITLSQEIEDLKSAIKFISDHKLSNNNIGLTAHSMGSFVILRYTANYNKIKALIPMSTLTDFVSFQKDVKQQSKDYDTWKEKGKINLYYPRIDRWYRLNYSFYIDAMKNPTVHSEVEKISCPILFFQGKNDSVISTKQIEELAKHLKCKHDIIILDEPHVYRKLSSFNLISEKSIDWFKKYLTT